MPIDERHVPILALATTAVVMGVGWFIYYLASNFGPLVAQVIELKITTPAKLELQRYIDRLKDE